MPLIFILLSQKNYSSNKQSFPNNIECNQNNQIK